jgi:hypothetical protein
MNQLYYGANLQVLRKHGLRIKSVDLIYLDSPFKSKRDKAFSEWKTPTR